MGSPKPDLPINQLNEDGGLFDKSRTNSSAEMGHEIILHEDGNPRAVANMLTGIIKQKFNEIPAHYFGMTEKQMEALAKPSELEDQIRLAFWDEYFVSQDNCTTIDTSRVYGRLCTKDYFYKTIVHQPVKFAYILMPPAQYMYRMRSLLDLAHKRFRQILEMPLKDGKNVPNIKLISEIVKIANILENRVHGSVAQNINVKQQSKNLNVNVNQNQSAPTNKVDELARIEREIAMLEASSAPDLRSSENNERQEYETIEVKAEKA